MAMSATRLVQWTELHGLWRLLEFRFLAFFVVVFCYYFLRHTAE